VAYVDSTYLSGGTSTSAAVPVPTSTASGQIAVVWLYIEGSTGAITPPDGTWTQKSDLATGAPTSGRLVTLWKRLTAADSGTWTFTFASSYREAVAGIWSGRIATGDPFGATSTQETPAVNSVTVTGLTAATGDDLVGAACIPAGVSWTPPASMTEGEDSGAATITLDYQNNLTSGATGNKTFAASGTDAMKGFIGTLTIASSSTDATVTFPQSVRIHP
jgi:hypothetical protein